VSEKFRLELGALVHDLGMIEREFSVGQSYWMDQEGDLYGKSFQLVDQIIELLHLWDLVEICNFYYEGQTNYRALKWLQVTYICCFSSFILFLFSCIPYLQH
jgi:hypothetical protein